MWGAPKWPPTPPSARRAPAEPWRASVSGLNRLDRARFAQRLDLLRVVAQEAAQHLACVLAGTVRCGARGRRASPVHHEGHAGDAHALARGMQGRWGRGRRGGGRAGGGAAAEARRAGGAAAGRGAGGGGRGGGAGGGRGGGGGGAGGGGGGAKGGRAGQGAGAGGEGVRTP